ncbi:YceI family protein [Sphingobacterium psychroaquaticum]|uniref:Polyisoprenoid-binding protein YceI n=1 Tax=Sphingobacterium psychroaquaticum TaxID=561061 RepID=A0A1X7JPP0_9SPHI|nr:YceI family protein [Sphingobacterium psychroaquaticum]SMG29987.1 Polyisoprenoid-binding protein YceI [Sphingobacterium psychroaquaticum]
MAKWSLDKAHSELEFRVKHMMISNVKGLFEDFDVEVTGNPDDISSLHVDVSIGVDSITTKNEQRDQHLRSEDFFHGEKHPKITFKSTHIAAAGKDKFHITGDLTIKGITKSIVVDVENGGTAQDPWGNKKIGFTVSGKLKREDFGLTWNTALETGGVMVSSEVKFEGDIQFALS